MPRRSTGAKQTCKGGNHPRVVGVAAFHAESIIRAPDAEARGSRGALLFLFLHCHDHIFGLLLRLFLIEEEEEKRQPSRAGDQPEAA